MDHELEHLVSKDADKLNLSNDFPLVNEGADDETLAVENPDRLQKTHEVVVEYHIVYLPLWSWLIPFPKTFKIVKAKFVFPSGTTVGEARDHAIRLFPEGHQVPDFTLCPVSYFWNSERYYVLDFSEDISIHFGSGERMNIFNDPLWVEKKSSEDLEWLVAILIAIVVLILAILAILYACFLIFGPLDTGRSST